MRRPGQLLRDGTAALDDALRADVAPRRGADADGIQPVVMEEALILDCEQRLDHHRRDLVQRHVDSLLDEKGEGRLTVPVVDDGGLRTRRQFGKSCGSFEFSGNNPGKYRQPVGSRPGECRDDRNHPEQHCAPHEDHAGDQATAVPSNAESALPVLCALGRPSGAVRQF